MKKKLTVTFGIDTAAEEPRDIISLILGLINTANDEGVYVIDAKIEDEIVFSDKGFSGVLRKRYAHFEESEVNK